MIAGVRCTFVTPGCGTICENSVTKVATVCSLFQNSKIIYIYTKINYGDKSVYIRSSSLKDKSFSISINIGIFHLINIDKLFSVITRRNNI